MAGGDIILRAVTHIKAEHIRACFEQRLNCRFVTGGRPQCRNNFHIPHPFHPIFPSGRSLGLVLLCANVSAHILRLL